jgi:hypothetical protein
VNPRYPDPDAACVVDDDDLPSGLPRWAEPAEAETLGDTVVTAAGLTGAPFLCLVSPWSVVV